jgi:hypothetical protein
MDYKTRRYKQGLEGKKPGSIYLDNEGHRAQRAGYRDHLRNRDLAEQIRCAHERDSDSSSDYESSPSEPLQWWQSVLWLGIGVLLLQGDYWLADSFATYASRSGQYPYWVALIFGFVVLPGGILGWPAFVLFGIVLNEYFPSSTESKPESSTSRVVGPLTMLAFDAVLAWGIMKWFTHDIQRQGYSGVESGTYLIGFFTYFVIFPGGFLFWPAMKSLYKAMSE